MRRSAARLMARDQLGRDFFARGIAEDISVRKRIEYKATVLDLMQTYARLKTKESFIPLHLEDRNHILTIEQALDQMKSLMGHVMDWADLSQFLPDGWSEDPKKRRSATAATFAASLELVKAGIMEIRQTDTFAAIPLRKREM
jgi:segregation and condensation protein A